MKTKSAPILQSLLRIQSVAIFVVLSLLGTATWMFFKSQYDQQLDGLRKELISVLANKGRSLSVWRKLELYTPLNEELNRIKISFHLDKIEILDAAPVENSGLKEIITYSIDDGDAFIVAKIDTKKFSTVRPTKTLITILLISGFIGLVVLMISLLFLKQRVYVPFTILRSRLTNYLNGASFKVSDIPAHGEIKEILLSTQQMYEQLKRNEEKAAKVQLAAQVAHDIKSPVFALNTLAKIQKSLNEDEAEILNSAVKRISEISEDLLNDYKNSSRETSLEPLTTIINSVLSEKKIDKQKVTFKIVCPESIQIGIHKSSIKRILSNLIDNSLDALHPEHPGEINIEINEENQVLFLSVADTGKGISKATLPLLMKEGATYGKSNGNGLGLFYIKQTVTTLGGRVSIDTTEDIGTKVSLEIPMSSFN